MAKGSLSETHAPQAAITETVMAKFNRVGHALDPKPMKSLGVRLDEQTRAMLRAIMDYEDRSTEGDTMRSLIRRAYRALPSDAQTVDTTLRPDEPGM
jgi:hypothetical protein